MESITSRAIFSVGAVLRKVSTSILDTYSVNRASAYLRARHCCSYDPVSQEQCMTLEQMERNKGVILACLDMLTEDSVRVNGYKVRYNPLWGMWQCRYDGALYGEFKVLADAVEYCEKG